MSDVIAGVSRLPSLELRVERKSLDPQLRRISPRLNRYTGVREEQPSALLVTSEHLRDVVRPTSEKVGTETRLKGLDRGGRLEPHRPSGDWHTQHRRPGPFAGDLDGRRRTDERADP